MGLLLYLIRKEEMDIFDINVSELTRQYLEHIRMMRELDLEVAGEFVSMAATLLHIKSRMLLPQYGEDGEPVEAAEDPRKELVQKILEYQRYQEAGRKLYERPVLTRDVWTRAYRERYLGGEDGEGEIIIDEDGLFGMIASYRRALRKMTRSVHQVRAKGQSIAARILEIKDRLIVGLRVNMRDLLSGTAEEEAADSAWARKHLLITFLSMLELGRMGFVSLFQNETYGDIFVVATRPVDRNVLERVQEFDSAQNEEVAAQMMEDAAADALAAEAAGEPPPLLADAQIAFADFDREDDASASDMASDEEIRLAEAEGAAPEAEAEGNQGPATEAV